MFLHLFLCCCVRPSLTILYSFCCRSGCVTQKGRLAAPKDLKLGRLDVQAQTGTQ